MGVYVEYEALLSRVVLSSALSSRGEDKALFANIHRLDIMCVILQPGIQYETLITSFQTALRPFSNLLTTRVERCTMWMHTDESLGLGHHLQWETCYFNRHCTTGGAVL